jgi:hypothetical protein
MRKNTPTAPAGMWHARPRQRGIHFTVYFYLPQNLVFVSADRSASHGSLWILPCGGVRDGVILAPALKFERYQAGILTHGNISSNQLDRSTVRRLL